MSEEMVTETADVITPESPVIADQNAEQAPAKPEEDDKPKIDPVQKRIDKLTREKYQLRGEIEAMRRERESWSQRPAEPVKASPQKGEPALEDFKSFDEFIAAKAEYVAEKKLGQVFEERERQQSERSQREQQAKLQETWEKRIDTFRNTAPDFDEVLESAEVAITPALGNAIVESDLGPQLAYFLARNPDEATKLQGLSPSALNRAIGRLEARIETESMVKKQSTAPKPVSPIGGRATGASNPDQLSDADWLKSRRTQQARKA